MKHNHSSHKTSSLVRLFQFLVFLACLLIAAQSEAQEQKIITIWNGGDIDITNHCDLRQGPNNFDLPKPYISMARIGFISELGAINPTDRIHVREVSLEFNGTFTADDIDNSNGGGLEIILNAGSSSEQSFRRTLVHGTNTFTFDKFSWWGSGTRPPIGQVRVHLSTDANPDHLITMSPLSGGDVVMTEDTIVPGQGLLENNPINTIGIVESWVLFTNTAPVPTEPENLVSQSDENSVTVSWDANSNEFHRVTVTALNSSDILQTIEVPGNQNSLTISNLAELERYWVRVAEVNTLIGGCEIGPRINLAATVIQSCFDAPQAPGLAIEDITSNNAYLSVSGIPSGNEYRAAFVLREVGTSRKILTNGVLPGNNTIPGNYEFDNNGFSTNISGILGGIIQPNTTYEVDAYVMRIEPNPPGFSEPLEEKSCIIYSSFTRRTFTTCPTTPTSINPNINFSGITENFANITWTNGNGEGRIVVVQDLTTDPFLPSPFNSIDGTELLGNTNFPNAMLYPGTNNSRVVYSGSTSLASIQVTDLLPDNNYRVVVYEYNGDGGCRSYRTQTSSNFTTLSNDLTVFTQNVTNRTPNSALVGGNVELINNVTVTERGVVWSLGANPDLDDNHVIAGSGSGAFTASITGLSAGRRHHVRAYAIANGQTFYANNRLFYTPVNEPTGDASNFILVDLQPTSGNNLSASLDWDGASGADGYLLLYRRDGTAPTTVGIEDGVHPEALDIPSGTFIAGDEVIDGTSFTQNYGVLANLDYSYLLLPVSADQDNNPQTYNYKTSGTPVTLSFSTDVTPPSITAFQPLNNATNVPTSGQLAIEFDEQVTKGTGDIEVIETNTGDVLQKIPVNSAEVTINNRVVTIDPTNLSVSTTYHLDIPSGAFEDTNGNSMAAFRGQEIWQFTTAAESDLTAPQLIGLTPKNGTSEVAVSNEFRMTFSEPVRVGSGDVMIKRVSDNVDVQVIAVDDPKVIAFQSAITIVPDPLTGSSELYITIDDGAITDLSGNEYSGINDASTWSFTTAAAPDQTAPLLTALLPSDDATGVALNSQLSITFDEAVVKNEGFIAIRLVSDGTARETVNVQSSRVSLSASQTTATITLASELPADTDLYIEISEGAFADDAGNDFAGISDAVSWNFTSASLPDGNQPQLLANSLNPSSGSFNVSGNTNLQFTFNENVLKGTGNIVIRNTYTDVEEQVIDVASAEVSISGGTVTIDPASDLTEGSFTIEIPATAFKDDVDNFYPGLLDNSWNFSTPQVNPSLVSLSPTDNSLEVSLGETLTVTLSEDVEPGTSGTINLRRVDNGAFITSFQPESAAVQYNGSSVSFDLSLTPTFHSTEVFIQIENGAFQDLNGNTYTGFTDNETWSFTIEDQQDVTGPQIDLATLSPANGSVDVAPDTDLVFSFNEAVIPNTVRVDIKEFESDITVEEIVLAGNVEIDGNQVTISRTNSLGEGRFYIEIDEETFSDNLGNEFEGLFDRNAWNFTTAGSPPSVETLQPAVGANNVGQVITAVATFDEPIMAGAGNIIVRNFNSNATIVNIPVEDAAVDISGNTLSVDIDLSSFFDIPVYIQVVPGAITDLFGNNLTELNNNTWNYTLVAAPDVNPPALFGGLMSALAPQRGSGTTPSDALLEMTFNEEVQAGPGSVLLYRYSDDQLLQGIAANSPAVTIDGDQVTIDPPQLFDDVQTYVRVSDDAFQDNSGNFFAGISDKDDWYFFPEISRPTLVSMNPEVGSTNLPVGEAISFGLNFSEDIEIDDTGTISVIRRENNALAKTVFLNDPSVQVIGSLLVFDVTFTESEFFSEMELYLSINGTFITDLNGNNISSFGSFESTGFTLEQVDITNPFIIQNSYAPAHNSNNVAYNTNLTFEMSEEVDKGFGNINLRNLEDDAIIRSIDVNSPEVSISGTTVTINPAEDLPEAQLYIEVEDDTFEDSFGNIFSSPLTEWKNTWRLYMFEEALEVVGLSPAHGSSNIQINEPLTFEATFSHPIEINTDNPGEILIRYNQGNGTRYTIPATDPSVSANGNVLRFDLTLDPGSLLDTELYVQLTYGVVRDVNGISKNLNFSKGNWHFTTEAATPPVISTLSPADDATGVTVDENIVITFSEDVTKLNFYAILRTYDDYGIVEVFDNDHLGVSVNGNQVTINPTNDFVEPEHYYITLSGNSVSDHEGAGNAGISGRDSWDFFVGDHEDPGLSTLNPEDNASEVDLDAVFTMTFDEPVFTDGAGYITLRRSTGSLVENVGINDARISGLGTSSISVDFNSTLLTSTDYYITIGNGVLRDAAGNTYKGITDATTWNFSTSTADIVNPTLNALSPQDDEGSVATNTNMVLIFNENMQWGTGDVVLKEFATDNVVETFNSGSANNSIAAGQLTLAPSSDLSEVTAYYIEVASDALEDASGNAYAGFTGNAAWNFTTLNSDVTGPSVASFSPVDNTSTVSKDLTEVTIVYSEDVVALSGSFLLRFQSSGSIRQSFDVQNPAEVTVSGNTITLHDVELGPQVNYIIQSSAFIEDLAGNSPSGWAADGTWNFGTFADVDPPLVSSFSPPAGTTGLSGDESFTITFNEDIQTPANYAITIKNDGNSTVESFIHTDDPQKVEISGNQVTINPTVILDPFSEYYITVSGFRDDYGNQFAGFSDPDTWDFVVGELDNDPPTITSLTPTNGSTDVALNTSTFSMTFSEPVFPVPGTAIRLRNVAGNSTRQEFFLDSDDVEIEGNTLTISNVEEMSAGWDYWLQGGTILTDEAGNLLSGWINNATTWSFTTEELPSPVTLSPANDEVDVSPSSDLVMTFNKPVQKGNGFIKLYDYNTETEIDSWHVASSNVNTENNEVTITIPGGLPDFNQRVYVLVDEGAFTDNNGNSYAGISSRFSWDFQLLSTDQEGPVITFRSPADNAVDVDISSNIVIEFDEDVFLTNNTPFRVKRYNVNNTQQQIVYPSDNITVDGNRITIEPIIDLPFSNQLWIEIPGGLIKDEVGNAFEGIVVANRDDWDFTMIDALNYQALSPVNFATDVDPGSNLELTFPRNVIKGSGSIRVFEGTSINELLAIDVASEEVQIVGNVVTIAPIEGLPDRNIQVHVQMDEGVFVDVFGNTSPAILNTSQWRFTLLSSDVSAPQPISFTPSDDAVNVEVDASLQIVYDEPIFFGGGATSARLRKASGVFVQDFFNNANTPYVELSGNTLTFTPAVDLEYNTEYYITFGDGFLEDINGFENEAINDADYWNFTTRLPDDTDPPVVTNFNPGDGASGVAADGDLIITFDEPIVAGGGYVRVRNLATTQQVLGGRPLFETDELSIDGNTLTIHLAEWTNAAPQFETEYYVTIQSTAILDQTGNFFPGFEDNATWNFTTEAEQDNTAPSVTSLTPADGATSVAVDNWTYEIHFDESIDAGLSTMRARIRNYDTDAIIAEASHSGYIGIGSGFAIINFNALNELDGITLDHETRYYIEIEDDLFRDQFANAYTGHTKDDWDFTTASPADVTAPSIVSVSPAAGSTDVPVDSDFVITFDEAVQKGSGSLVVSFYSSNGGTQFIDVNSDDVAIDGNTVTIDPPLNLLTGIHFWMRIPTSAFEDLSGNSFAGINVDNKDDWEFTTSATTPNPPVVSSLLPAADATAVALDSELSVTFSENVMLGVNGNTKQLIIQRAAGGSGNFQVVAVTGDMISGNKLTIPHDDFEEGITYRILMAEGVIADMDNNSFDGFSGSDWTFTTIITDTDVPQVVSLSPADNATNVSRTNWSFDITFDEAIQKGSGTARLRVYDTDGITANASAGTHVTIDGNTATIDFNANGNLDNSTLNASTRFYIEIPDGLFEDLSGNAYSGHTKDNWDFTTAAEADVTAPSVVSFSPADNATNVSRTNWSFDITFDEAIQKGSGTARLRVYDTDGITANALAGTHVTIDGNTATIDFNANGNLDNSTLNASTRFYIEIPDGLFEDLSGNAYSGHTKDDWDFTTAEEVDVAAPTIVSVSPATGSTDVPVDSDFVITFDEAVRKGSGSLVISFYSSNGGTQFIDVNSDDVTIDGNTVTIDPPLNLLTGLRFWMRIPASAFEDLSGNNFAGISIDNKDDWEFTTSDTAPNPPVISSLQPADGASGVALDAEISITFSEDIMFGVNGATKQAVIRRVGGGSGNFQVIALTTDMISGNTLTIPHNELEKGITYSVLMNTDVIADLDNNSFTGLAVNDWAFTTLDNQDQTITFNAIEDKVFGDSFELDATASSGLPVSYSVVSGPISLNGATVTVNGVGVATIAANQAGDAEFNPAPEVTQTFNILKADQIITIEKIDDKLATDAPFDVVASVDSDLPLTYEVDGPASILGTTVTLSGTSGTVTVTVAQAGNENYNEASSAVAFRVSDPAKTDQTITFETLANKTFGDAAFNLTASASSGLDVTFSVVSGPIAVSGVEVTITGAGTAVIAANQAGDDDFNPAPEVTQSFEIAKAEQVIAIQPIDDRLVTDTPFDVVASINSGLELSLEVSGPATISGTTITLDGSVGTVTVTASQAGNDNYNSASESVSFDVTEVPLSIGQDLASVSVYPNPTTDYVTIEGVDESVIQLFNLEGRKLIETTEQKIDLRHLASGSYILLINNEKRLRIIKAN